jgi:hypothetical protein
MLKKHKNVTDFRFFTIPIKIEMLTLHIYSTYIKLEKEPHKSDSAPQHSRWIGMINTLERENCTIAD